MDNFEEVIYEFPDDTSPEIMEDDVNEELDYMNQNDLNDENKMGLHKEEGKKSTENVNYDMMNRNMNENDTETNLYALEELLDELSDDTSSFVREDSVKEELEYNNQNYLIGENDTEVNDEVG